jgi:hypothetical protein
VRASLPRERLLARLSFAGEGSVDATETTTALDLSTKPLTIRFDPVPSVVSLDGAPASFDVVATIEDEGATTPGAGLALSLTNESGAALASATTNGSGRAWFSVAAASLGPPGRGELRVAFAGSADIGAGEKVAPIDRHTKVDLAVPAASAGKLTAGSPEDGIAIDVTATARASGAAVPGGSVTARVGDVLVGAAPIDAGKSRVVVTFAAPGTSELALRLHFASDAPWFEASDDLVVMLPVRGPSPLRHVPIVVAGLAVLAWLVLGRARAPRRTEKSPASLRPPPRGEPAMHVVRAPPGASGWRGVVVDAHEGRPIAGVRVAIEHATFETMQTVASATTDERGEFEIAGVASSLGDVLCAEGPLHAPLRQPIPPAGEVAIALVLRKRALLDRLVAWARRRGRPFDAVPEPTPGHVRRAAGGDFAVARWADAVERAAFGGGDVDARVEADVQRLLPDASPPADHDTVEEPPPPMTPRDPTAARE